jgi:hypothetical protein
LPSPPPLSRHSREFPLSILSLSLLTGVYASNGLSLHPINFDCIIGQGKSSHKIMRSFS